MLRNNEEKRDAGGLRRINKICGYVEMRIELDPSPAQRVRLERFRSFTKPHVAAVSTKVIVPYNLHRSRSDPPPCEAEGVEQRVEGDVEHNDDFGIVRVEVRSLLEADPAELLEVDAHPDAANLEGGENVSGRGVH